MAMTEARLENRMDEALESRVVAPEWIGLLQLSPAQAFAVCHIKRERQHQHQLRKPPNLFLKIYNHHSHWPMFVTSKISQGLRHIENPQNCPPCPQPYFLNEGLVRGVATAADRRVFARIQITLPCQSRFLARNSRTALFAAQGPLAHKDLCLFISPYKNNLVAGRSPLVDHLLQMIVGDSCGCEGR